MPEDDSLACRLGRAIRRERLAQGLRQTDLSRVSGVAAPTISDIENAARDTRLSSVQRLLDVLLLDPETALTGKRPEKNQPSRDVEPYDLSVPR
ncbi:MAG: helix-turn-helix transcriptional regulator [Boseongicola sp. SB0662_bin_57]|nr:helix-turn-helix transcriptional regulator [Boseongicola sp. SB0667_bin_21]MYA88805.1 helix-turn-helix transcriptional regulator [Boseongicola sp. SB0662_bin_57]MYI68138.1 helix-turn-helix transcriptional regulator [Boseongicola sp. SB0673_bin_14]